MPWLLGLVFLFLFQHLTEFIAAIYAFGLLQTDIPPELAAAVLMFSPFGLMAFRHREPRWLLPGTLVIGLWTRALLPFLPTRGVMVAAGMGVAALFLLLPLLLSRVPPRDIGMGLGLAVAAAALLRAWGAGLDPTTQGNAGWLGLLLTLLASYLAWHHRQSLLLPPSDEKTSSPQGPFRFLVTLALGEMSTLALLYFAFVAPNVLARWVGWEPAPVFTLFAVAVVLWTPFLTRPERFPFLLQWGLTILFGLSLVLTLLAHQIPFPVDPQAYPLYEPPPPFWASWTFVLMVLSFPVLVLDFTKLQAPLFHGSPRLPTLGLAFGLGSLYLFVLVLGHVFTTTYDYIPVVGPFFRDRFWLVHLVPVLVLVISLAIAFRRGVMAPSRAPDRPKAPVMALLVLAVAILVAAWAQAPRPTVPTTKDKQLRVVTYNIQQGYREDGERGIQDQLVLLRELQPDLIGLQETDSNRVANGNVDLVGYLASELNMYAYYGPKVVHGTFGIALLSRYPLEDPRTFFMYSEGEQTATIQARITVQGQTLHVFVTHLGNGGPIVQQENILQVVGERAPLVLMGDFNFRPDTPQYRLTTERLVDAWRQRWPQDVDDRGIAPKDRIDHIFLSSDLQVQDIRYIFDPASDHPAVLAVLTWP